MADRAVLTRSIEQPYDGEIEALVRDMIKYCKSRSKGLVEGGIGSQV